MKKLFVAVLAIAALAACNKDNDFRPAIESHNKSVAVTIVNAVDSTRGEAGTTTPGTATTQIAVANSADLKILFAQGDVVMKAMALDGTAADHEKGSNGEYMYGTNPAEGTIDGNYFFHNVPASITKIAIVRYEDGDIDIEEGTTTLTDVKKLATSTINENREIDNVCLYGEGALGAKGEQCVEIDGVKYYVYPASVEVKSQLARLEINNIGCTDLGDDNDDDSLETVGIDELVLNDLKWGAASEFYISTLGTLTGSYDGENADSAVDADYTNRAIAPENNKVWSWNFVPQAFSNIVIDIDAKAHNYTLPSTDLTLEVIGLNDGAIKSYEANTIYQLNIEFTESNLSGQEGVCVNATVNVVDWTVKIVTPQFAN